MLISYYANKKSSPRLPSWQPSLIPFNTPIDSGSIIKPCTLKHFQVPILAPGLRAYLPACVRRGGHAGSGPGLQPGCRPVLELDTGIVLFITSHSWTPLVVRLFHSLLAQQFACYQGCVGGVQGLKSVGFFLTSWNYLRLHEPTIH